MPILQDGRSVLRVGPVIPGDKNCLIQRMRSSLLFHFSKIPCDLQSRSTTTPKEQSNNDINSSMDDERGVCDGKVDNDRFESKTLHLSNKYFSAKVLLEDTLQAIDTNATKISEDGIMLVFNDNDPTDFETCPTSFVSFDSLQAIHDESVETNMAGDLLRLCVGVNFGTKRKYSSEKLYEQEYSRRILWCLDHGYEYVEADLSDLGVTIGHDDRDKDGFARIVEAICGTVWSEAVMFASRKERLAQLYQEVATSTNDSERNIPIRTLDDTDRQNPRDYTPPNGSQLANAQQTHSPGRTCKEEQKHGEFVDQFRDVNLGVAMEKDIEERVTVVDNVMASQQATDGEHEYQSQIDSLESALNQARRIREMSLSGALTDDQRKQRASDAALLLFQMMGELSDDDGDDGDDA